MVIMATSFDSGKFLMALGIGALITAPLTQASASSALQGLPFFSKRELDSTIPEQHRHSFKSSRNNIVMVFEGTHWHSLGSRAVTGSMQQQRVFCEALTRSDRSLALIPRGFSYSPGLDGRVYLLKTVHEPVVAESSAPQTKEVTKNETIRRAIVPAAAKPANKPKVRVQQAASDSYRTDLGNILMVAKGDNWVGRAPESVRGNLSAPAFCDKAAARDRLKGLLPSDYTYVLLEDDTLVALSRMSGLARLADAR